MGGYMEQLVGVMFWTETLKGDDLITKIRVDTRQFSGKHADKFLLQNNTFCSSVLVKIQKQKYCAAICHTAVVKLVLKASN